MYIGGRRAVYRTLFSSLTDSFIYIENEQREGDSSFHTEQALSTRLHRRDVFQNFQSHAPKKMIRNPRFTELLKI